MANTCPKGKIRRKGYVRKDGIRVRSTCVPDKGKPGKTPASKKVLPTPKAGGLGKYGYKDVKGTLAAKRRAALTRAVKAEGYATIVRRLNLIANYNKRSDPRTHKLMRADMDWIKKNLHQYSKAAKRVSRKASKRASRKPTGKPKKTRKVTIGGKQRQLYRGPDGRQFYRYRTKDGKLRKRHI